MFLKKNTSGQTISFCLVNASTGAALTGATVSVRRCLDGTFAAAGGTVTEDSGGLYKFAPSQADTNADQIAYYFTATSAVPVCLNLRTTAADMSDSVRFGLTALPNATAGANGGLPTGDASGRVAVQVGTGTGQINVSSGKVPATLASTDVTGNVAADLQTIKTQTVTCAGGVTIPAATLASTTNITAATGVVLSGVTHTGAVIPTVTSVTNRVTANTDQLAGATVTATTSVTFPSACTVATTTGAVGSVTGAVGSVTGAVGSVTGNVGGNVAGSVGSVTARVTANTDQLAGQTVTAAAGVTFPTSVASPTNITAGTITTVTNLTNAPTAGDFTATMKTSLNAATPTVSLGAADSQAVPNGTGTATAGGATSITLQTALGADSLPVGCYVKITSGTGAGQERVITGYVNSTKVVTVGRAWVTNPDNTSVYAITYNDAPKVDSSLKISGVVLADTLTTYTGNTPQTGDSYARIGATGSGLTSLAPAATALSTATWSNTLATNLTTLASHDPGTTIGTSTYAGADTAGTTTLLSRLSATRAGYLDNLSGGAVALASGVNMTAITGDTLKAEYFASMIGDGTFTADFSGGGFPTATLGTHAIQASTFAPGAIDDTAVNATAVTKIQSGLATASSVSTVNTTATAIKAKTDNLPASPAAVGSAMTLTSGERDSTADALIARNIAGGSSTGRTVGQALASLRNKVAFDVPAVGQFTVFGTDDVTPLWTGTYTASAGANPVTVLDPA